MRWYWHDLRRDNNDFLSKALDFEEVGRWRGEGK